jgi:D-serine deaminase-like pyridoxal phosphate-dependent protein
MNITKPTLIVEKEQVIANIENMVVKADSYNLFFRPHFKTHQSRIIGEWFRNAGVTGITVSSVEMAEYFQSAGWHDITIAFPCNILESDNINDLAGKCDLKILIVNQESVQYLCKKLTNQLSFFIEIDNGYHRTGVSSADYPAIDKILSSAKDCNLLEFKGFLTHSGNSYQVKNRSELEKIHRDTLGQMRALKVRYSKEYHDLITSLGDTPCCSLLEDFNDIDEIRPGNFVFYDLMQEKIGSCNMSEIAVSLACPVIAKNQQRLEIAVYGGAIHLSKEHIINEDGDKIFGRVVLYKSVDWTSPAIDTEVISLSQEHGIIKTNQEFFDKINVGDVVGILPVHSCLTADSVGEYVTSEGEKIDHL